MTTAAVLIASLLGSLHCAAMCGGFAVATGGMGGPSSLAGYHLGRGLAYISLGAIAGAAASVLDVAGETLLGVQRIAGIVLGVVLILLAMREMGWLPRRPVLVTIEDRAQPRGLLASVRRFTARQLRKKGLGPAFTVGALNAALPCGWLWGFVALAGATGAWRSGGLVMGAFWAGTVPALLVVGGLSRLVGGGLRAHAPKLTALGLLMAGLLSLAGKWMPGPSGDGIPSAAECHAPSATRQ